MQLLMLLIPIGFFIGSALCLVVLAVLQFRLAGRVTASTRVAAMVLVLGIGAILSVALTARSLDERAVPDGQLVLYSDYANGFAAARWSTLVLLGAAVVEIIRGWTRQRRQAFQDPAWPLLLAILLFYFGTTLIQAFVSEHPGFSYHDLYVPIVLIAVYYLPVDDLAPVLRAAKAAVLALTLGSLLGIVVRPDFVLHRPDGGVIPGVDWRLFGLTPHANTLGPTALLGLILELYLPYKRGTLRWFSLAASIAVLVLAQSRTAWAASGIIGLAVLVPRWLSSDGTSCDTRLAFRRAVCTLLFCIALLIVGIAALTLLSGSEYLQRKTEIGTLNGRFQIWDITLEAWRENLLFGYGPDVWGPDRRLRFHMFHVGQAHNQFVQTLGEAGLAGMVLLFGYLITLAVVALRRFESSRGLILAFLALMLTRCVTESPMRSEGLLSWPTFLQVLLVAVACHHLRRPAVRRQQARSRLDVGMRTKSVVLSINGAGAMRSGP